MKNKGEILLGVFLALCLTIMTLKLTGVFEVSWWIIFLWLYSMPGIALGVVILLGILFILADTDILTKNK